MGHPVENADVLAPSSDSPNASCAPQGMEGSLGILYMCGEQTNGEITIVESLLGRKVRGVCGGFDQFVTLVDAWELEWPVETQNVASYEGELVAEGLQDVKVHHVAVGKNHRVALSLDGQLFSWGRRAASLRCSELGHRSGVFTSLSASRAATPAIPEAADDTEKRPQSPTKSTKRITVGVIASGTVHRVLTAPELFFSQVSCGKHHSAAVTNNGDVYTWGRNFEGQLGRTFTTLPKEMNAVHNGVCAWPKYVGFFLGKPRVVSACCGSTFTAVLLADGSVYILGGSSLRPSSGANTTNTNSIFNLVMEKGSSGKPFVEIAAGYDHVLALTSAGQVFSWGLNTYGQLGHGGKTGRGEGGVKLGRAVPKSVECDNSIRWTKVFAGGNYSAALTTNHQLFTWGNGRYGKLGHGKTMACEFVPRCVESLQHTAIGTVVCAERNLFAFAPTFISSISPLCGEHTGGYELRLRGSGFWSSENLTVRFVPMTEGRLMRGTLGAFNEATGEIVCEVPKFRLSGEFAVEVSMNGKHFTSNGRVFTVFKRPHIAAVSAFDARFTGGEEVTLSLCGSLPEICRRPIVRFVRSRIGENEGPVPLNDAEDAPSVTGVLDERPESVEDENEEIENDPFSITGRLLRLKMPVFTNEGNGAIPYTLDISYDAGEHFSQIRVDSTLVKAKDENVDNEDDIAIDHPKQDLLLPVLPHVIWVHDAKLVRVSPNSFLTSALPRTIRVELQHLLPPEVTRLSVNIVHFSSSSGADDHKTASVSATLPIDSVEGNIVICSIPTLQAWQVSAPANSKPQSLSTQWWKTYAKAGFAAQLRVSMNSGRNFIPGSSTTAGQVFALSSTGRLLNIFPNVGMVTGGTQVAIAGDFFHFDTFDAVVKLQWRESSVTVSASCLRPDETKTNESDASTRRVVFRTPTLPFTDDTATAAAMSEGMVLGTREQVEVFVSLDGLHFTETGLEFLYCAVPEMISISPQEAEPGAKLVIAANKVIATSAACVKLVAAESRVSLVVPVEIMEASHTAEFVLPELPIRSDEMVYVALSLNGQEFTEGIGDTNEGEVPQVSFLYKASAD